MALSSFNVQVDLGIGGINTGVSPEKVVKGGLQQLHNGDISVPGRIRKRRGRSVNIAYGSTPSVYEKVSNLFCSDKSTYRIVDGLTGTPYTGNWFSSSTSLTSRTKVGHKILQRLIHTENVNQLAQWRDVGAYPTPIVEEVTPWQSGKNIEPTGPSSLVNTSSSEGRELVKHGCCARVVSSNGLRSYIVYGSTVQKSSASGAGQFSFYIAAYDAETRELVATLDTTTETTASSSLVVLSACSSGRYAMIRFTTVTYASGHAAVGFDADTCSFGTIGGLQLGDAPLITDQYSMQCAATKTHFVVQAETGVRLYTFAAIMAGGILAPAVSVSTSANGQIVQGYQEYGNGTNFGAIWWSNTAPWTLVGRIWDSTGAPLMATTTIAVLGGVTPFLSKGSLFAKPMDIPHTAASGITNSNGQSMVFIYVEDASGRRGTNVAIFGDSAGTPFVVAPSTTAIQMQGLVPTAQPFAFMGAVGTNVGLIGDIDNNYLPMISVPESPTSTISSCFLAQFGVRWITSGGASTWEIYSRVVAKLGDGEFIYARIPVQPSVSCAQMFDEFESAIVPIIFDGSDCRFLRIQNNSKSLGVVVSDGNLELGNGGYPCSIGDNFVHEREPLNPPQILSATPDNVGSGAFPIGTYLFALTTRIAYPNGLIARSLPSLISVQVATHSSQIVLQTFIYNRCTNAPMGLLDRFGSNPITIEIYASQINSTILYAGGSTFANSAASPATSYTLTSQGIPGRPILYTVGGEIENVPANSCKSITSYRNRKVSICGSSESSFWISKEQSLSSIGQFTDVFRQPFPKPAWEITATEELDDKLILFCQDSIWYVSGDGPNDTGTQGGFAPPTRLADGIGCVNARSLVRLDNRIIFRAREGFYFLNSNLSIEKVSMPTDWFAALNRFNVVSAIQIDSRKSVYFFTKEGWVLTFYPETGQWSADNAGVSYGTRYNDNLVVLRATDGVSVDTATAMDSIVADPAQFTYGDYGTTQYSLIIKTGWIDFAGLQNLNRVWRCILLGRAYSNCTLNVGFSFDYHPQIVHTQQIPVTPAGGSPNILTYQDPVLYEQGFPSLNADLKPAQWRITMPRQKIESVQLTIWDSNQAPTASTGPESGASFELNQITFECGLRQAVMKLGTGQSY